MGKIIFFSSLTTQMLVRGNVLENLLDFAVLHWRHEKKLQIVKGQINSKENLLQKSFKEGFETKTQVVPKVWGWENSSPLSVTGGRCRACKKVTVLPSWNFLSLLKHSDHHCCKLLLRGYWGFALCLLKKKKRYPTNLTAKLWWARSLSLIALLSEPACPLSWSQGMKAPGVANSSVDLQRPPTEWESMPPTRTLPESSLHTQHLKGIFHLQKHAVLWGSWWSN